MPRRAVAAWRQSGAAGARFAADWMGDMAVGRVIGWLLIVFAVAALGHEGVGSLAARTYDSFAFGELWYMVNRGSLNLFQAIVQRHIWPWLWDGVITNILLMPAWLVLGVPGGALAWACRNRTRARKRPGWN